MSSFQPELSAIDRKSRNHSRASDFFPSNDFGSILGSECELACRFPICSRRTPAISTTDCSATLKLGLPTGVGVNTLFERRASFARFFPDLLLRSRVFEFER